MKYTLLSVLMILASFSQAQKGWEIGANLGTSFYFGDLNTNFNLSQPGLAGRLYGRYNFDSRVALRGGVTFAQVSADDANSNNTFRRARNLSFKSNIFDLETVLEFNFFPYIHGSRDKYYTPYIFGGFAFAHFNPRAELDGETYDLRDFGTEGQATGEEYSLWQPALTYGMGLKWDLSLEWSLNVEISARNLFSDYLDDVSTVYPNQSELLGERGPIAVQLSDRSDPEGPGMGVIGTQGYQRGDSNDNDRYMSFMVGVSYYFTGVKCPPISRRAANAEGLRRTRNRKN